MLNEATLNLDTESEGLIQKSLQELKHLTIIINAHRLSTIKKADKIWVIENGKIAEIGSHESLIAQGGRYHDLYTS